MKILVINAGSSSLKFQLIDMDDESVKAKGLVERIGIEGTHFKQTVLGTDKVIEFTRNMKDHTEAISAVLSALTDKDNGAITSLDEIGACGHRVLHGGETFKNSVLVTEETMKGIEELVPLGPLHQPANIAGIKACQAVMPNKPNVAVFDTAFHQTMPKKAFLYGVPYEYYTSLKVRRHEPPLHRGRDAEVPGQEAGGLQVHHLPPGQRLFPERDCGRQGCGYLHGSDPA